MTKAQGSQIQFGNTTIPYEIRRTPNRSSISVNVHPDGTVTVDAPKGSRKTHIAEAVQAKQVWILNQQEHFRRLMRTRTKRFVSGESFLYLGRQYKLMVLNDASDETPTVRLFRGQIEVRTPATADQESQVSFTRSMLIDWYRGKALRRLKSLTKRYARNLGVEVESVRVREMKSRWGSANHNGWIAYNWKVILAPKRLVEYVVAHEVCHLKHDDHSREFWRLLERAMPDYERRRLELAVNGPKYDLRTEGETWQ